MDEIVALRLDTEMLRKIEAIMKDVSSDRSVVMRTLLTLGIREFMKEHVANLYRQGKITLSHAARSAGLTFFEMEQYLIEKGYRSDYSLEDLEEDMKLLNRKRKKYSKEL